MVQVNERIRILVVEDQTPKRDKIISQLRLRLAGFDLTFVAAANYEEGRDALRLHRVDFVIMDIKIPVGMERPSEKWSRTLLTDILNGELCFPLHVFGLTAYKSSEIAEREFYDENLFGLYMFDWVDMSWADQIATKVTYLARAIQSGASLRLNSYDYDIVITVARYQNEFEPVKKVLFPDDASSRGHPLWNRKYDHFGPLKLKDGTQYRAALLCIGDTGLAPAAALASQAILVLRPRMVVMLGMCAGFKAKGIQLMDVLAARSSACWQEGKALERDGIGEFDLRGPVRNCSQDAWKALSQFEKEGNVIDAVFRDVSSKREYRELVTFLWKGRYDRTS